MGLGDDECTTRRGCQTILHQLLIRLLIRLGLDRSVSSLSETAKLLKPQGFHSSEVLYYACRLRERKTLSYILKSIILAIVKASNMRISYIEFAQQHQVSVQI